jgi:hypothetical protein
LQCTPTTCNQPAQMKASRTSLRLKPSFFCFIHAVRSSRGFQTKLTTAELKARRNPNCSNTFSEEKAQGVLVKDTNKHESSLQICFKEADNTFNGDLLHAIPLMTCYLNMPTSNKRQLCTYASIGKSDTCTRHRSEGFPAHKQATRHM